MSTNSLKDPHGIARIGRLELVTATATPQNAERIATTLADRVKTTAASNTDTRYQFHGEIAEMITTLMDIHHPEQRLEMPEAMFDRVTIETPGTASRGDIVHDGTLTGLKVEVEDSWAEDRVDDQALLWSRKLRLTPTGRHAARAGWAPRNYVFGFWGTWSTSDSARRLHVSPAEAWTTIFEVHGHKNADHPDNRRLRYVLDSRAGRHYADEVLNGLYDGTTPLREAIQRCRTPNNPDAPDAV